MQLAAGWASRPLPEHIDLLVGGFPCQDYSVAKTLKQASGIVGPQGRAVVADRAHPAPPPPTHVLLENVDRLLKSPTTERGRDFAIMLATFAYHGYEVEWRVINAAAYGYPQRRRRVFIYARHLGSGAPRSSRSPRRPRTSSPRPACSPRRSPATSTTSRGRRPPQRRRRQGPQAPHRHLGHSGPPRRGRTPATCAPATS
jgi:site-specific DNA-cytosine methylase